MKKILLILVILVAISSVFAFTDYLSIEKDCKKNGGTWVTDPCTKAPCPYHYGHCEFPSTPATTGGGTGPITTSSAIRLNYPPKETAEETFEETVEETTEPIQQETTEETVGQGNQITGNAINNIQGQAIKDINFRNYTEQTIAMAIGIIMICVGLIFHYKE